MKNTTAACCLLAILGCTQETAPTGTVVSFDLDRSGKDSGHFFDFPFPSDLRTTTDGHPDLDGFPVETRGGLLEGLIDLAEESSGFSTMPTGYFRFSAPLSPRRSDVRIPGERTAPILLIDVDPRSPTRGHLYPTVADDLVAEPTWGPATTLAVAPWPGIVLRNDTTYAMVVTTSVHDAEGQPLVQHPALAALAAGKPLGGSHAASLEELYAPLWQTLEEIDIAASRVAAATVFTTGDVVSDLARLTDTVGQQFQVSIDNLHVDDDDGANHERFCELVGTESMPQFQTGTPPFNDGGRFDLDPQGVPEVQRYEEVNVVITIPRTPMPKGGFPLMMYFHGSGGVPSQLVDRGRISPETPEPTGEGPAFVVAEHGIASFAAALPLSPERLPGASDFEYINVGNLAAFRDTFRQGVIEQRLLLDALLSSPVPAQLLAGCALPETNNAHFDPAHVVGSGQSMGSMYTNLFSAVEPRIGAVVPTGAGGFWHKMILTADVVGGAGDLVAVLLDTDAEEMTFLHPALSLLAMAWEGAEPFVFMPRVGQRPLAGHPSRPIYQPIGFGDLFFPTEIYDAATLAYGNQLGGESVWPGTQDSLAVVGKDKLAGYPVENNVTRDGGNSAYTGIAVQYRDDGLLNAHYIFAQLDEVKYQYGCFFASFIARGTAVVPAPAPGNACPN